MNMTSKMKRNGGKKGRIDFMLSNISILKLQLIRNQISSWKTKTNSIIQSMGDHLSHRKKRIRNWMLASNRYSAI